MVNGSVPIPDSRFPIPDRCTGNSTTTASSRHSSGSVTGSRERFPTSSLARVSEELLDDRPRVGVARGVSGQAELADPGQRRRGDRRDACGASQPRRRRFDSRAALPAGRSSCRASRRRSTIVVFLGIAIFFLLTIETRLKRRRALAALHQLRSIAHVVDMHQLTKDPEQLLSNPPATASSPARAMTRGGARAVPRLLQRAAVGDEQDRSASSKQQFRTCRFVFFLVPLVLLNVLNGWSGYEHSTNNNVNMIFNFL